MPTNLQYPSKKRYRLLALFLLSPLFFYGQTLTGLWTGSLSNDSSTSRKDQLFEIALTEYNGKVYGYSRSEFIVNDTLYFIVKRVKGKIEGDQCEVIDDEIISYNFIGKLDKGIKVTSTFRRNHGDSSWYLAGTWKTNSTKKYYAVTGKVTLSEEKDLASSKLFPHLEELNLANDVAFYKERTEPAPVVKLARPEKVKTEYSTSPIQLQNKNLSLIAANNKQIAEPIIKTEPATPDIQTESIAALEKPSVDLPKTEIKKSQQPAVNIIPDAVDRILAENQVPEKSLTKPLTDLPKTDINNPEPVAVTVKPQATSRVLTENQVPEKIVAKPSGDLPKTDIKNPGTGTVNIKPAVTEKSIAKKNIPEKDQPSSIEVVKQQAPKQTNQLKPNTIASNSSVNTQINKPVKSETVTKTDISKQDPIQKNENQAPIISAQVNKPKEDIIAKAAVVSGRKSEFSQMVSFKSDSLELAIYDNGEIDGDTVSIFMNGEVILSKQGLKSTAIKKTIYITPGNENFTLVLFAENLGKYPPNTGLLVVHDGDDVYNLRFSSDFQKNAGIIFNKKRD